MGGHAIAEEPSRHRVSTASSVMKLGRQGRSMHHGQFPGGDWCGGLRAEWRCGFAQGLDQLFLSALNTRHTDRQPTHRRVFVVVPLQLKLLLRQPCSAARVAGPWAPLPAPALAARATPRAPSAPHPGTAAPWLGWSRPCWRRLRRVRGAVSTRNAQAPTSGRIGLPAPDAAWLRHPSFKPFITDVSHSAIKNSRTKGPCLGHKSCQTHPATVSRQSRHIEMPMNPAGKLRCGTQRAPLEPGPYWRAVGATICDLCRKYSKSS